MNIYVILFVLFSISTIAGLWKIFEKAGEKGWIILIPFYNLYIWLKIIKKPLWWYIFLLIPFINVFVILLMIVEICKCFLKYGLGAQALGVLFPFVYLPYLGFSSKEKYVHPDKQKPPVKTTAREWVDAVIFAVIAASIIRMFFIEAYTIPTSSMEKSLLIGDYLFVSKISYGPKFPNTPLSFPFVHHTLPLTENTNSYLTWISLPYKRFPGFEPVKNMDVVVFNYPDGDTVSTRWQSNISYYQLVRQYGRDVVWNNPQEFGKIIARPVDKRENFIKRCIGIGGDTIRIIDRHVFINGKEEQNPGFKQFRYKIITDGSAVNERALQHIDVTEPVEMDSIGVYEMTLSENALSQLRNFSNIKSVTPIIQPRGAWDPNLFPYDSTFHWNVDNYGPVLVPKKGSTVALNSHNICFYRRIIGVFEGNKLEEKGGKIYINGKQANSYTFKMNYYWMMGDNRHNSADSRYWGFVPEDHVVGKAVFVWLSMNSNRSWFDGKIRWNKLFRIVK
ncbi:MAG: signal peptidase I [Bacteroidota bacterium]|nr:signal peptidase I [Bacteroidota bacterium]